MNEIKDSTLRDIRERAGLNQTELAERMHLGPRAISDRERKYRFEDLPIAFVRDYIRACGGEFAIVMEISGDRKIMYKRS